MTPEQLKAQLFQLSNSEEHYRTGIFDEPSFPIIQINGQSVMKFSYADISIENNAIPFLIRKHSRFHDYPLHIHDWIEISYMYAGHCVQIIDGTSYHMEKGQLLFMEPNTIHTIEKLGENDILVQIALGLQYLTANFFNRLSSSSILSRFFTDAIIQDSAKNNFYLFESENSRRLGLFIDEFLCEYYDPSIANLDILNNLFSLILSELANVLSITSKNKQKHKGYLLPLLNYIESHYKDCTRDEVAAHFGLNPNYMSNLLKKYTGQSFNQLVTTQKLAVAQRLLTNSDLPISDIANYIGYQNITFFYKIFEKHYGILPGSYRKCHTSSQI